MIAESDGRSRGRRGRSRLGVAVRVDRDGRPLQRAQPRQANPEERAAPLGEQGVDQVDVAQLECVGDLGGHVPGLPERCDELGVQGLGPAGRVDPDGELGGGVEAVLELRAARR